MSTTVVPSYHKGLERYEQGTVTWIGQVGHWHVTADGRGRRWVKGPITECPEVKQSRRVL